MSGYIGSKSSVTQVDGYNRTEADDRYVNASGDTMTGQLGVGATDLNSNKVVIEGGNAGQHSSNLKLTTGGGTSGLVSDLSFYATFVAPTSDTGPRRTADITSGYATDNWGNEYLAIGVGGATDAANVTAERFRIDGAGRVTMPYQPAFYASIDYDDGGYVTNYDYTWLNRGSHFNASTGLFTAPVSGMYVFAATIMAGADAAYAWWKFSINGAATGGVHHTHTNSSESYRTLSGNAIFQLSQNDTVGVYMGANTAYSSGPNPWSSFSGYLLG